MYNVNEGWINRMNIQALDDDGAAVAVHLTTTVHEADQSQQLGYSCSCWLCVKHHSGRQFFSRNPDMVTGDWSILIKMWAVRMGWEHKNFIDLFAFNKITRKTKFNIKSFHWTLSRALKRFCHRKWKTRSDDDHRVKGSQILVISSRSHCPS